MTCVEQFSLKKRTSLGLKSWTTKFKFTGQLRLAKKNVLEHLHMKIIANVKSNQL